MTAHEVFNLFVNTRSRNCALTESLAVSIVTWGYNIFPEELDAFADDLPHDVKICYFLSNAVNRASSVNFAEMMRINSEFEKSANSCYLEIDKIVQLLFCDESNWEFIVCLFAVMRGFVEKEEEWAREFDYCYHSTFNSRIMPCLIDCFGGEIDGWIASNNGWISLLDLSSVDFDTKCARILSDMRSTMSIIL